MKSECSPGDPRLQQVGAAPHHEGGLEAGADGQAVVAGQRDHEEGGEEGGVQREGGGGGGEAQEEGQLGRVHMKILARAQEAF